MQLLCDKPFTHLCRHGIQIDALRCDLRGGVTVRCQFESTTKHIAEAVAQAFGYHAAMILPDLLSFSGYNTVEIKIEKS